MKSKFIALIFTLLTIAGYSQVDLPNIGTGPDNGSGDNLRTAMQKLIANDAYLDTAGVQRLDSLLVAGVGESYTAGDGLTLTGSEFSWGGIVSTGAVIDLTSTANLTIRGPGTSTFPSIELYDTGLDGYQFTAKGVSTAGNYARIDLASNDLLGETEVLLTTNHGGAINEIRVNTSGILLTVGGTTYLSINSSGDIIYSNLRTNCTGAVSGSVWNEAGTLKICP